MRVKDPLVSIVVVNYNGKKHLKTCFSSLFSLNYPKQKLEVIMVDNGSKDGSALFVRKNFSKVKIIKNAINNYTKANNLGIKASSGEFIALINNDVKVDKNWLAELIKVIQKNKKIGAVGSKILFMDGSVQSVGHQEYPNFYWGDIGFRDKDGPKYKQTKEVSSICGCSILFRKKCLDQVGLLDEDFNLYMEDVDMAIRCRKEKWKLVICPKSIIYHKHHGTIKSQGDARDWQEMNRLLLIAKHWPDQLPNALTGRGHYSKKENNYNSRDIGDIFGKVMFKLAKEHGEKLARKLMPGLFETVGRIYNFEKDHLMQVLKDRDQELFQKRKELELKDQELWREDEELAGKVQELEGRNQELLKKSQDLELKDQELARKDEELAGRDQELVRKNEELAGKVQELEAKNQELLKKSQDLELKDQELARKDEELAGRDQELGRKNEELAGKDQEIEEKRQETFQKEQDLEQKDQELGRKNEELAGKDQEIEGKNQEIFQKQQDLEQKDQELELKDQELARKDEELAGKEQEIEGKRQEIFQKEQDLEQKDQELELKDQELARKDEELAGKVQEIEGQRQEIFVKGQELEQRGQELARKDEEISQRYQEVSQRNQEIAQKNQEILQKERDLNLKAQELSEKDGEIFAKSQEIHSQEERIQSLGRDLSALEQEKDRDIADKIRELAFKDEEISLRDQDIVSKDQHIATLGSIIESFEDQKEKEIALKDFQMSDLQKGLETVISQKDQEISARDQEICARDQEISARDQEIGTKNQELDSKEEAIRSLSTNLENLEQQKNLELNNLELLLQKTQKQLNDIYASTGFKYLLKPLWDFLWPIKRACNRSSGNIRRVRNNFNSGIKDKTQQAIQKTQRRISKIRDIFHYFPIQEDGRNAYTNHIKRGTFPPKPKRLTLMLNRVCNLRCLFCDVPSTAANKGESLSKENAFRVIDEAKAIGVREIILTGGEPFLHPDIFEIIGYVASKGIDSVVTTNGTLVKRFIDKIVKSGVNWVCVSIDGQERTHDLLRNRQGTYQKAMEAIELLRKNEINTAINFVVTNKNVYELEDIYRFFSDREMIVSFLPVINKPELFLSRPAEKNIYLKFIKKLMMEKNISVLEYKHLKLSMVTQMNKKNIHMRCLGLNNEFGVDTTGEISPCCVWENRKPELNHLGNILETGIEELWYSQKFRDVRASIFNQGCENCFNPSVIDLPKMTGINFVAPNRKNGSSALKLCAKEEDGVIKKPVHVHMRFTSRCNLTCRLCDIWKNGKPIREEISVEDWKKCINKLYAWLGPFKLDLAGGEILLYKGAVQLFQYCANRGITVNLTTNATLINDEMAQKIVNSGLYCVNLSLDGLEDAHCHTRNNPLAFKKVQEAASNLLKYRKHDLPYISLTTVINKSNLQQLTEVARLPDQWGINNISFQALDHNFGAKYHNEWFKNNEFWPNEYKKVEKVINELIKMKKKNSRICNPKEQLITFKKYFKDPKKAIKNQCFSATKNFIVNEYGEVLLCWNMPPVGNLLSDDPDQIWKGETANKRRKQIERCTRTCRILNCNFV